MLLLLNVKQVSMGRCIMLVKNLVLIHRKMDSSQAENLF